jgi:ATP-dependent DNA helicase RecG
MKEKKTKVFISSVQNEFEIERAMLEKYISTDVLLKSFFHPFLFEKISATDRTPEQVFLSEVQQSDIYIGILGKTYGYEDASGISPTEKEYNAAKKKEIPRWIYILKTSKKRHPKEDLPDVYRC